MAKEPETLLVETLAGESMVIAEGGKSRDRRLANMFRGQARVVEQVVLDAARSATSTYKDLPPAAALGAGVDLRVIPGPEGGVAYGVTVQFGQDGDSQIVGTWQWELGLENLPPRLLMSVECLDIIGMDHSARDRVTFGPADFFSRVERLSDVVALWTQIKRAQVGEKSGGTIIIRTDSGELRRLRYVQACVETPNGPRMRGVCTDVTDPDEASTLQTELADTDLSRALIGLQGMFGIVGDLTFPGAPCIVKWLTNVVPEIGHGVSTGQTPAIHPEDIPKVLRLVDEVRTGPVSDFVRVRRGGGGGGWLQFKFIGQLLNPASFPTVGLALVYPDTVSAVTEASSVAEPR